MLERQESGRVIHVKDFLIKRGKPAVDRKRHAHIAKYNAHGEIDGSWCGSTDFDLSSNMPWGLKICKHCINKAAKAS